MRNATANKMGMINISILIINILLRRGFESLVNKSLSFTQLPGSATLTKPFSRAGFIVLLIEINSLVILRRLVLSWPYFSCPFVLGEIRNR